MGSFFKAKLNRKVSGLCILLAVIICTGCCISGFLQYRDSIYQRANAFAYELAYIARSYVNGDRITSYLETGETDAEYDEMAVSIYAIYRNTSLYENKSGIYIFVPNGEKGTITNIFDVRVIEAEDKSIYAIGCEDPMGVEHPENVMYVYNTGFLADDYFVHKTKFGYNSSAVLPIYNSNHDTVALIVADMPIPYINETLNRYLLTTVLITVFIVALFMFLFINMMNRTVIRPIKVIASEANSFSRSDIQLSEVLPKLSSGDEIGQLSESIFGMERDIQIYVKNLTAVTAEKERIGAELDVARNIQASMLPCIFPAFPDRDEFDVYASMNPAKEVGGDFYDFFMIDDRHIAIVMADVSGKGVPAALFMVIGKTLIKDHTQDGRDLAEAFSEVNNLLCEANSEGLFITAFEGVLDLLTGEFKFVNAGHEMPFIFKKSEGYKPYKIRPGFVLAGMEDMQYRGGSMQIEIGDKIFEYTDGVTEATDRNNQLFGMERLENALNKCCDLSPTDTVNRIKEEVDTFADGADQFDDITMLCLEYRKKYEEK